MSKIQSFYFMISSEIIQFIIPTYPALVPRKARPFHMCFQFNGLRRYCRSLNSYRKKISNLNSTIRCFNGPCVLSYCICTCPNPFYELVTYFILARPVMPVRFQIIYCLICALEIKSSRGANAKVSPLPVLLNNV